MVSYPVFDRENEAGFALEGRALRAALTARDDSTVRRYARWFLALREGRQRRLGPGVAEFEAMAELNEGLAQYIELRARELLSDRAGGASDGALPEILDGLDRLIMDRERSFRLRFYRTGPAIAVLLDRLSGPDWKEQLVEADMTLQDALAWVSGYRERELVTRRAAAADLHADSLAAVAARQLTDLRQRRQAMVDSVMSRPGLRLRVETAAVGGAGLCGMDPQNLLQVGDGTLIHTRYVRPCAGRAFQAQLETAVVHDRDAGVLRAVIGPEPEVRIQAGDTTVDPASLSAEATSVEDLRIEAPGVTVRAARAELVRHGAELMVRVLSP